MTPPDPRKHWERIEHEFHPIAKRLTRAELQRVDFEPICADDLLALGGSSQRGSQFFLGYYSELGLDEAFRRYGIWDLMRHRGVAEPRVRLDLSDPFLHRLLIYAGDRQDAEHLMGELRARVLHRPREYDFAEELDDVAVDFLYIEWLLLQNPTRAFSERRPALPGQSHPGLGIGLEIFELIRIMAERLELAGIVNVPAYYNNAYLYQMRSTFLLPEIEGRFHALRRDLEPRPLAEASWAVQWECVVDRETGDPFVWQAHELCHGLIRRVRRYFKSRWYKERRAEAFHRHRFVVDEEAFARKKAEAGVL